MERMVRGVFILSLTVQMALSFSAEKEDEYSEWMKTIGATVNSLQTHIDAGNADAGAADARSLQTAFKQVREFWQKRDAADAVRFAKQAERSLAAIAKMAAAGQVSGVGPEMDNLKATCGSCHNVHRYALPGGAFRIF
jgi:cytochrome c556